MPRGRGRRYRLLNHVHGLPFDPPRWGERPRLRDQADARAGRRDDGRRARQRAGEHPWLLGSFVEDPLPDAARELWDLSSEVLPRQVGHGTFVCGVILQYAPAAKLLPRRVIDMHGDAFDEELADVVRSLIPENPDVVNLSLGPTPVDEKGETDEGVVHTMAALADLQRECGTVVVSAAGDIGEELPRELLAPPGPLSLIVGALDLSGQPAWFSGAKPVTIWAPGVDVLSSFVHHSRSGVALASTRPRACARRYRCRCRGPWRGRCPRPCPRPCRGPCRGPCRDFGAVGAAARTVRGLGPVERNVVRGARSERCDRRRDQRARRRRRWLRSPGAAGAGSPAGARPGAVAPRRRAGGRRRRRDRSRAHRAAGRPARPAG